MTGRWAQAMPDDTQIDLRETVAKLWQQLDARTAERDEALEQQTATAEVLQVINSSSGDLGLVFETLLGTGARLCKAEQAVITLRNQQDGLYHYRASFGYGKDFKGLLIRNPVAPGRASLIGRTALEGRVVHIEDAAADPEYQWAEALRLGRWRTGLGVPLLRDGAVIGTLALTRRRIERFTNKQIELVKTFADQAVIAIENARLLGELRESEERYGLVTKAVAEGIYEWDIEHNSLWVSSRLIEIFGFQGRNLSAADWNDLVHPEDFPKYRAALRDCFKGITARLDCEYRVRHSDGQYRWIEDRGVPIRNASGRAVRLVGAVSDISARKEADEVLREALEQQTATAEVLGIINASPGNLAPVFGAILDKAHTLCGATLGSLFLFDGELFRAAATHGYPDDLAQRLREGAVLSATAQLLDDSVRWVHNSDLTLLDTPTARAVSGRGGVRTNLMLPLRKDGRLLGAISCNRQEVRPFSDKEIALLENFAAQAVIAMENARLLTETREALQQQTATAEVLQVINSSPGYLAPVFDAILEKAHKLCEAPCGSLQIFDGEQFRAVAVRGFAEPFAEMLREGFRPPRATLKQFDVTQADMAELLAGAPSEPILQASVEIAKIRTVMFVPLRREEILLGRIVAARQEVRPFTDKQIALLQNFAAQAVIAMENARLLTETREALEQQTATAEVLQVINSSPGDLAPVFDAMLEKAMRLCEAAFGILLVRDGSNFRTAALHGVPPVLSEFLARTPREPGTHTAVGRMLDGEDFVHFEDMTKEPAYQSGDPRQRAFVEFGGTRTYVAVALRKDGRLVGTIGAYRQEVRPFTERQIALLQNFAAQAVIAIENARLINETREALEQQTATAEVLQVINSSPGDLTPVFDAMLQKALSLCGAAFGQLVTFDGVVFRAAAWRGYEPGPGATAPIPGMALYQLVHGEQMVHIPDITADDVYRSGNAVRRRLADEYGGRTTIWVALRKDATLLGAFVIYRSEVRPFSDKQIALLQNFAAQAVIAIENARLITETREALDKQTATAEILRVISGSPTDLQPTFDAIAAAAKTLTDAALGCVLTYDGQLIHWAADSGWMPDELDKIRSVFPLPPNRGTTVGRAILTRQVAQVEDMCTDPEYAYPALAESGGHTVLAVPMLRDGRPIGAINVQRRRVELFNDRQIDLLKTFADQAVIAIENVRLFNELNERTRDLQESLEYQTATSDVLKVISRSTFDLEPVLQTVLNTAMRLCGNSQGSIFRLEAGAYRLAVDCVVNPDYHTIEAQHAIAPGPDTLVGRTALAGRPVQILDALADADYAPKDDARLGGYRTMLGVPLLREGVPIGVICTARAVVQPFTDKQIELVRTFADQAVIAIENTRLLTELRESLEQQQAIAEVLQVINSSPGDLEPVFDAMLEKALGLCGAAFGALWTYDGERVHAAAVHGAPPAFEEFLTRAPHPVGPDNAHGRLLRGEPVVHIADVAQDEAYRSGDPVRRNLVELAGGRTLLAVPLRKDGAFLGDFVIYRQEVRPFSDRQIALLQNFAAQAVIAIDNAQLLEEIRQRQAELRVTFDNMGDGVAMFDGELHLAAWNHNFQEMLDLPDAFLAKRPSYAEYFRYLAERGEYSSADLEGELRRAIEDTNREMRFERTRPDGRVIEVRRNAVPAGGFVLIYADITERKRAEAEIRAARDAAERALAELQTAQASLLHAQKMAALGQLTAGIAHEIKNPLNFVNNFADLSVELLDELKENAAPAVATLGADTRAEIDETVQMLTANLGKIAEHGRRADGIVRSMLTHSRGSSGDRQRVDINALVEEALNLAYHGARAQDQNFNITLECELDHSIGPIELVPQDMTRVFLNLFGNGFHAAHKRQKEAGDPGFKPVLKVTTRDVDHAVEVRVRDNGTGILPEHRDKLFQPFFTTKPTGEGTGLGLSISYEIVTQQHGGTIAVDSEVGEFTEFTVHLPRGKQSTTTGRAA
jgi:PAS domain S-box-containing protein